MIASSVGVAGRRVLVVEDEYLLASKIAGAFAKLGVETIGPVGTVKRALELVEHSGHLDGAVLDIKLRDGMVFPVAEALRARGVPFVFTTGYNKHAIPDRYKDVARYEKPFDPAQAARALFSDAGQAP
jgi:CheY-like chemotaxis protein